MGDRMTGPLANARQERFAQEMARGAPASRAYVTAGYVENDSASARLYGNVRVKARIAELLAEGARLATIDAAWVLRKAVALHDKALRAKAFSPAARALELIGKNVDVQAFRERHEHAGPGGGPIPVNLISQLSDDDIETIERIYAKMALPVVSDE